MNPFKPLVTPQYLFRPRQLVLRLKRIFSRPVTKPVETVVMPWGACLRIHPGEVIGSVIWWYGIFDLLVSEAIHRLLDPGETAVDVGANIGHMTSLMQYRAGSAGRVISFEPHPELFAELSYNVGLAQNALSGARVDLRNKALSDWSGEALLDTGPWEQNRGMSRIVADSSAGSGRTITTAITSLDASLENCPRIGVCKIDVEGHELSVLKGARGLLASGRIRDIIFEDLGHQITGICDLLKESDYTVFALRSRVIKPELVPAPIKASKSRVDTEYLATSDPDRARARFRRLGWEVLRQRLPGLPRNAVPSATF